MNSLVIFVLIASLWTSTNCVTFSCSFGMTNWGSPVGKLYTCYVHKVLLSNGTELQQVIGQHEIFRSDAKVNALEVYNTNCPFIPTKIETFFPNLLAIQFETTNLKVLISTDLRPFPMLKVFLSRGNLIESLDDDVFDINIQLELVDFRSNKLVNVGLNLLDKLTKLQVAYFQGNPCINFMAGTPAGIAQLKQNLINQCPPKATTTSAPTCGIIEEFSLCEAEFSYLIDSHVAERTNPLMWKVLLLDKQQIETQKQVTENDTRFDELEQELSGTRDELSGALKQIAEQEKQIQDILRILEIQQKV